MINYGKQCIEQDDIESVIQILKSEWLTQGPVLGQFEQALAEKVQAKYAVAVSSGTAALHLACLVAGLNQGDLAVTSALTFIATANAPKYCGASTEFIDIDSSSLGMSLKKLHMFLESHPETKVILPVHFAGLAQDMKEIQALSEDRVIIEDAAHALGGIYENEKPVGSCAYSDMTIFSFHPVKSITTGEGGAITTNNIAFAEKLRKLRNHGIERDFGKFLNACAEDIGLWYYEQQELGFNYRLSDLHAALGLSQLKKLDKFIASRREIAKYYDERFGNVEGITPNQSSLSQREKSVHHLYTVSIDYEKYNTRRDVVMKKLKELGINVQVHYIPLYKQPFHEKTNIKEDAYLNVEKYYRQTLSIPIYPRLSKDQAEVIADNLILSLKK